MKISEVDEVSLKFSSLIKKKCHKKISKTMFINDWRQMNKAKLYIIFEEKKIINC